MCEYIMLDLHVRIPLGVYVVLTVGLRGSDIVNVVSHGFEYRLRMSVAGNDDVPVVFGNFALVARR